MAEKRPRLYLIDGTALAYRAHFAFAGSQRGGLSTVQGRPTSAIYGFISTLLSLIEREKPDRIVISFDSPTENLARTQVYPQYKSTRSKMPEEMADQLETIEQVVQAWGIPVVRSDEHEADDVIGTLAVKAREAGMEVFIVTSDKDFMQIVGPHIHLWNLRASTRAPEVIGPPEVEAKFGVPPERMIDLLALMGDSSDNIPGVPKVGAKTAAQLLLQFGDLEGVLTGAEQVTKPSIRQALHDHAEMARLSRQLVTLHCDVPMDVDLAALPAPKPDRAELERLFRELEFESLLKSLPPEEAPAIPQRYSVIGDAKELDALLEDLRQAPFALAVSATGTDPMRSKLLGLSFSKEVGVAHYVPLDRRIAGLDDKVLDRLKPLLEDAALPKVVHEGKRVRHFLQRAGTDLLGIAFDTMLASYCLEPGVTLHDLDALALRYFAFKKTTVKDLTGTGKKQKTFAEIAVDEVGNRSCEDADFTWRLHETLAPELEQVGVGAIYRDLEMPLVEVLLAMEREGIAVDEQQLRTLSDDLQQRITKLEQQIFQAAGEPFTLGSPAQVGEVLFNKLEIHKVAGITRPKRTRTGQIKTDAQILELLAEHHPVPRLLLDWRQLTKLKSTYIDSLPAMVHPETGRIHTTFNQAVAATGRLSSDNPNLQNIPIRTEEGRNVRRAFVSRAPDWVLLSADYNQIELRILAHLSEDPALVESFRSGEDIHVRTAALAHGIDPKDITPEIRNRAKVVNYGLMYGMGPSRLARETGMTPPEAKQFIDRYFAALPKVKALLDGFLQEARSKREVWTMFGRRRPLPDIDSSNPMQRVAAENMAVNTPIQGSAADIIKRAMLDVHAELLRGRFRTRLLLQVHDELVFDVPKDELDAVQPVVRAAMAGAADMRVPLEVSMGHGRSWLDAH